MDPTITAPSPPSGTAAPASPAPRAPMAWGPVLLVVAVKVAIGLVAAGRYGWHRDELYYAEAARHLDLGFVDFPSVTPLLAALSRVLFGESLVGLRSIASLAGAGVIVVTAAIARRLGGRRRAQTMAAVAIAPLVLGSNAMFQTVSFDQLTWALLLWAAVALLQAERADERTSRAWAGLAAAVALAWSTKYTVGVLLIALAGAWLATASGRRTLRGRAPWLAAVAVVIAAAPNLWWQARHGWPSVDFFTGRNGEVRDDNPPLIFALELIFISGPVAVPLALAGLRSLVADRALRPVGLALVVVAPMWLALGGKSYYAAPLLVGALAAGAVRWEARLDAGPRRSAWTWPAWIAGTALLASPIILPVLPTAAMVDLGLHEVRDDYAEQIGWPELAATVDAEWTDLSDAEQARTTVVAGNYGEAGAIARFTRHDDLIVVSGHLTHRLWPVSDHAAQADRALIVGYGRAGADDLCATAPRRVATIANRWGVDNEEAGAPVWHCSLRAPLGELRDDLAHDA